MKLLRNTILKWILYKVNKTGAIIVLVIIFYCGFHTFPPLNNITQLDDRLNNITQLDDRLNNITQLDNDSPRRSIIEALSSKDNFLMAIEELYDKYGNEIASYRPKMKKWCNWSKSCKFCDHEAEMLYMLLREYKPQKVFEMAPNRGYSTHWILHALHQNDNTSMLHSIDIHNICTTYMDSRFKKRWNFTHGDYADLYDKGKLKIDDYDFIFLDALHEPEFSRGYCKRLLAPHKQKAIVAIHDIVGNGTGDGRESSEVYKYMAFDNKISNVFTMSSYFMPNIYYPIKNAVQTLNIIRSEHKIIKPCKPESVCSNPLYDPLYFKKGFSPSIFFQLN